MDEREHNWEKSRREKDIKSDVQRLAERMRPEADVRTDDWNKDVCQGIIMAYFLVMTLIYPLYAPGGYLLIGDVKYDFFRDVSLTTIAVMAVVILIAALRSRHSDWLVGHYRQMSVTDWFAYGYFVAVMLSYLCSDYKEEALWGAEGWHMGAVTQMIFVLVYFLFSRYFHKNAGWIGVWLAVSAIVFALGICNRYSVYPIAMEGQTDTFISTLGNINWFCGYWSVAASVGIALYWCGDRGWIRLLTGIYSAIAMLAGVTQGSNSAYLVFGILCAGLFLMSLGNRVRQYRFLELCIIFAAVCQFGRVLRYVPGLDYNYGLETGDGGSRIMAALLDSNVTLWGFVVAILCYGLLRGLDRFIRVTGRASAGSGACMEKYRRRNAAVAGAIAILLGIAAGAWMLQSAIVQVREETMADRAADTVGNVSDTTAETVPGVAEAADSPWIVFPEDWGNGRGAAWNCGIDAYRRMDLIHKLVGAGPDCFADYVYDVPKLAQKLTDRFTNQRLTNAHNELLTQLVNVGALGLHCYTGIFLSAFLRCLHRADRQPVLYICILGILAYTAHGMVSFQQILNAPYIFIVMGIGERYCRSMAEQTENKNMIIWEK